MSMCVCVSREARRVGFPRWSYRQWGSPDVGAASELESSEEQL